MREDATVSRARARSMRRSMTKAELWLWQRLRARQLCGLKFRRQHPIGPYIADFACLQCRLVVELDGATHSTDEEIAHDRRWTAFIERDGWRVLRFWNTDLYDDIDETLNRIAEVASARTSSAQRMR
ncbi:endonuclease domain-containing protein [Maricaulis sp.]|uniref:endonuclease domain-containing protein n=1 Tax=Maricaulis sp. TaxID=1486257 RepID=UPI0032977C33